MDLDQNIDMKKQLSIISFSHEVDHPELQDDFWSGIEDIDMLDEEALTKAMENSDLGLANKLSKSMSAIHSENVKFKYEYVVPNAYGGETVYISGQFNNWDFEEMTKDGNTYKIEKMVKGG